MGSFPWCREEPRPLLPQQPGGTLFIIFFDSTVSPYRSRYSIIDSLFFQVPLNPHFSRISIPLLLLLLIFPSVFLLFPFPPHSNSTFSFSEKDENGRGRLKYRWRRGEDAQNWGGNSIMVSGMLIWEKDELWSKDWSSFMTNYSHSRQISFECTPSKTSRGLFSHCHLCGWKSHPLGR